MEFFIDTGHIDEVQKANEWGIIDGVTTNPSLIGKTGKSREAVIEEICRVIDGPVSAEVIREDKTGMIREGEDLAAIHPNVVVKLPLTEEGLTACRALNEKRIKTNVTLCFSVSQALLAAKSKADYVSPFVGRLDDRGENGTRLIENIRTVFNNYGFPTKILAASIRHDSHVTQMALAGADVATIPWKVLKELYKHPLTDKGLAAFLADHARSKSGVS